jgi:RNA polymerase sigma factor (sigma-70 family)
MNEDAELLRRYAEENSEAAFAELVPRHIDHVYSTALRLVSGDTHRAKDVTQMVFVSLARKASALTRHPVLAGWLYTATHHAAAQVVRGEARRRRHEEEAHMMNEILKDNVAGTNVDWARVRPVLDATLRELGERDREAVVLRFFAQRPFAEIGRALRVSEDAARMRVERAVEKLRLQLVRRGVNSSAGALAFMLETQAVGAAPSELAASITNAACAAGVSVGPPGLVAQFMAETKVAVGVASALACVLGVVGVNQYAERRDAHAAREEAARRAETMTREVRALTARATQEEGSVDDLKRRMEQQRAESTAARSSTTPVNETAPTKKGPRQTPVEAGNAFLERHPKVKNALDEWANAAVDGTWHGFYLARGLTAAQIDEFRYLVRSRSFIPGEDAEGQVLQLLTGAYHDQAEIDRRLRTLLGEEGFADYRQRMEQQWGRQVANAVAGALCFSDTPLSEAQHGRLVETMTRHRAPPAPGSRSPVNFDWTGAVSTAAGFLGAQQMTALEAARAQAVFEERWSRAPNPLEIAKTSTPTK